MNKSWLESPYLHWQIRPLISASVVLLKYISKWIWWTWRKNISSILLKEPEGNSEWYRGPSCRELQGWKERTENWESSIWRESERSKSISELTFTLQKMVEWLSPCRNILHRSPASKNVCQTRDVHTILYEWQNIPVTVNCWGLF